MNKYGKICILTSAHAAFDTRIFHKEAKTLSQAGYKVTLIAQHDKNEAVDGVSIIALPTPRSRFSRILGMPTLLKLSLQQKAEVYHFHDGELIPVAILIKLIKRAKVIYDVHEDVPKQILTGERLPSYSRGLVSRLFAFTERVSFPFFDGVVTAGEDICQHLPQSPKVVVIRNFAYLEIARRGKRGHSRKDGRAPAVLIYVGRLGEARGAKEMVEAVSRLGGKARLVLVGTIPDPRLEAELRAKASKEVEFVGQVPYAEVFPFMRQADIGLVCFHPTPSNIAASWRNNKLFEYMAVGLPVIASNFPSWREVIEGNRCGITVNPLSPQDIAEAVEYLLSNPTLMEEMGGNGRKAVLEKYNWEKEGMKLLDLYQRLLAKDIKGRAS